MYLSFDVLARELGRNLPIQTYNVTQRQVISDIQVLPIPFLPGQQELKPDTAYLCNYWQLKQFDPHLDLPPICCVVEPYVTADPVFFKPGRHCRVWSHLDRHAAGSAQLRLRSGV